MVSIKEIPSGAPLLVGLDYILALSTMEEEVAIQIALPEGLTPEHQAVFRERGQDRPGHENQLFHSSIVLQFPHNSITGPLKNEDAKPNLP
jgi:hypothetical protein